MFLAKRTQTDKQRKSSHIYELALFESTKTNEEMHFKDIRQET